MRLLRALAAVTVAGASLVAMPPTAHADAGQLSLALSNRWQSSQPGFWTPYVATVRNDGATDFSGDVVLQPIESAKLSAAGWPAYRAHVVVPHGSERSVTLYVVDAPSGYAATLKDPGGHDVIVNQSPSTISAASYTVGVLSDQPQAGQKIESLKPLGDASGYQSGVQGIKVSRFGSAQGFPTNAVYLAGLHAVVVDDFDASTLSDAQLRALRDFVELGGSLVVAGGSAWRRTLLPLADHELGLLRPTRTEQVPVQPLADMVGRTTSVTAAAAVGTVTAGRMVLGAPNAPPLAVQARLGAGRILDLAFDPLDQTFTDDGTGMAALAWSFALDRMLYAATPSGNHGGTTQSGYRPGGAPPVAIAGAGPDEIGNVLSDTPLAQVPPVGLLGGLLVFYVLLAGPVNYIVVRSFRRGELAWITVPALALLFTAAAYVAGTVARGATYFDNGVQVLRVAPDGAVEVHGYHAVYPPHRGDFRLSLPSNTLASTVLSSSPNLSGNFPAVVDAGSPTIVEMLNTPLNAPRMLQTMSVSHPPLAPAIGLETHLQLVAGRVQGSVRNTGERELDNVVLVSGSAQVAAIAASLPPRATANVDTPWLDPGSGTARTVTFPSTGDQAIDGKRQAVLRIAEAQAISGRQGDLTVVGVTATGTEVTIGGLTPAHSGIGGVVVPVAWDSIDTLTANSPKAELALTTLTVPNHQDVFDLEVPGGFTGRQVKLNFYAPLISRPPATSPSTPANQVGGGGVRSVEVYDWTAGTWRAITLPQTGSATMSVPLKPSEYSASMVRVRVDEVSAAQSFMSSLGLS